MNLNGTSADNFPFELKDGDEFIGMPLLLISRVI